MVVKVVEGEVVLCLFKYSMFLTVATGVIGIATYSILEAIVSIDDSFLEYSE